jgi:hypothetical protein
MRKIEVRKRTGLTISEIVSDTANSLVLGLKLQVSGKRLISAERGQKMLHFAQCIVRFI